MRGEALGMGFDPLHAALFDLRAVAGCLLAQSGQQRLAGYAGWKAGVVARARNQRGAAGASVHHPAVAMKAGEVKRCRQPARAAADDQAVDFVWTRSMGFVHAGGSGRVSTVEAPRADKVRAPG